MISIIDYPEIRQVVYVKSPAEAYRYEHLYGEVFKEYRCFPTYPYTPMGIDGFHHVERKPLSTVAKDVRPFLRRYTDLLSSELAAHTQKPQQQETK